MFKQWPLNALKSNPSDAVTRRRNASAEPKTYTAFFSEDASFMVNINLYTEYTQH